MGGQDLGFSASTVRPVMRLNGVSDRDGALSSDGIVFHVEPQEGQYEQQAHRHC